MREVNDRSLLSRSSRFEVFEDRLAFSAQALSAFLQSASQTPPTTAPYNIAAETAAAPVHSATASATTVASNTFGYDGTGQTVAVIDSGIAYDQTALGGAYGSGSRVVGGYDFANNDADPYDSGAAGFHGTFVSGIIGSTNAAHQGVAPGVDLVALRVFDDQGNSSFAWIDAALKWVDVHRNDFANPITTVNLSIGTNWNANTVPNWGTLEADLQKLKSDGIFIAVAAGNGFAASQTQGLSYPAVSPYVVPVASYDTNGQLSAFSQRNDNVIAAPGQNITSTVPGALHGTPNDHNAFDTASGTSMAAPYVAGAAVLIREAMEKFGYTNINEDTINADMRATADSVYDPITKSSYLKLNLENALEALQPAQPAAHAGSTANTAIGLGSISGTGSVSGTMASTNDANYYSFTASQTGTINFTANDNASLKTSWQLVGGAAGTGNSLNFSVVAGHAYTVGLTDTAGAGTFGVTYNLQAAPVAPQITNWGTVSFSQINNQNLSTGDAWYQITASRTGTATVEALFNSSAGNVSFDVTDANKNVLASSTASTGSQRADVSVTAGQTLLIHVRGTNAAVNFRVTDLVAQQGSTVQVYGTSGNDNFTFVAGAQNQLSVNGVSYSFNSSTVTTYLFHGGTGTDTASWTGTTGNDQVTLRVNSGELDGKNLTVKGDALGTISVNGGGGIDTVSFYGSNGSDQFQNRVNAAQMTGAGYANYAANFQQVYAYAAAGSNNQATLYDTAGNDTLQEYSSYTTFTGVGMSVRVSGFTKVVANSSGGSDSATLYDSSGNDTFVASATTAQLSGVGFSNQANGFRNVVAYSTAGGSDSAVLSDSVGNNTLLVTANATTFSGTNFSNRVNGFANVKATAINSTDKAIFQGMASTDQLIAKGSNATWQNSQATITATGFGNVSASTVGTAPVTAEISAVDFLLSKVGNWRNASTPSIAVPATVPSTVPTTVPGTKANVPSLANFTASRPR